MKVVKFIEPFAPYTVGDIAGLDDREARKALESKKAVLFKKEKEDVVTEAVDEAPADKMVKEAPKKK
jgi:hypothetical protein